MSAPATHSVPRFAGRQSRGHRDASLRELKLRAALGRLGGRGSARGVDSLVQFVGFPRSGHSLIGSLLDAHPRACIAHELDLMGLVDAGFSQPQLLALVRQNARAFTRHGRWWNGFSYAVDAKADGAAEPRGAAVLGDKKGDWAVRRFLADPRTLERLRASVSLRARWILVTRDPFDNIATLSLRRGGAYDRLRIAHAGQGGQGGQGGKGGFREALHRAQRAGDIAAAASDDMIDDYASLCDGVERLCASVEARDWYQIVYERFTAAPSDSVTALFDFCALAPLPDTVAAASALVKPGSRSRASVAWTDAQLARVHGLIERHDFLSAYRAADAS